MTYSRRNSALFPRRFSSLCCPGRAIRPRFASVCDSVSGSGFRKAKTLSSRRIHLRARETKPSSRLNISGVNSRYCETRLEPTRREYSWWR